MAVSSPVEYFIDKTLNGTAQLRASPKINNKQKNKNAYF